jgi:fructosamine-3-kinase
MVGEAAGLKAMNLTSTDLAPEIIALELSEDGREGGMITQYWDLGGSSKSCEEGHRALARKIAGMHTPPPGDAASDGYTGKYGFEVPTHCGVTQLDNTWEESWEVFYRDRRLGDIINRIGDDQINTQWEKMKEK